VRKCGNADTYDLAHDTVCLLDGEECDYIEEFGCRHDKEKESE